MIRCYKCGTLAIKMPDGTARRACQCYLSGLIYTPEMGYTNAQTAYVPPVNESVNDMQYRNCPLCGEPVFSLLYHHCKGVGSAPDPKPQPDDVRIDHVDRLRAFLAEHERECERCSYFYGRGEKTRCATYLNFDKTLTKWEKRIGVQ